MPTFKISTRFRELLEQVASIEATKKHVSSDYSYDTVDLNALLGWKVKCLSLLSNACGIDSEHYKAYSKTAEPQRYRNSWEETQQLKAIMIAAQEDYDGGYLDTVRSLVQAELFSDELDQARGLLDTGYLSPAAVVAGVVLETKLREMCDTLGLEKGKLDRMNAELAKSGQYSVTVQKRITACADVRNNAAHGHPEKFTREDVADMIGYIERFLSEHA